jgi:hypothetical protein
MTLLRWAFFCLMTAFATGMIGTHSVSPTLMILGTASLYFLLSCFAVLATLGAFVFPRY